MPATPTFPMLVGGRLRRAEAGRGRPVHDPAGALVGVATTASASDVSDAVAAARTALPGWSGTSAYERGRVLHGVGELLDERRDRLGGTPDDVGAAVDRWLWYAGWTDKISGLLGAVHPVTGPYASWSAPRPVGVVGALAPTSALGLVDVVASVLSCGATVVVLAPQERPLPAAGLAEVLATALPAGVANLLVGDVAALAPALARDGIDGLDTAAVPAEIAAGPASTARERGVRVLERAPDPGLARLRAWSEVTTVWHPAGR